MEVLEVLGEVATWRLGRDGYVGEDWREVESVENVDYLVRVTDHNIATF